MKAIAPRDGGTLEIRIPISPTRSFFAQVRFFEHCLRRLGPPYDTARLRITVGNDADMDAVRRANRWSAGRPVEWIGVPAPVFAAYDMWGTADYRYFLEPCADLVVLADADTIWLRDIDPLRGLMAERARPGRPGCVAGHMAHVPPHAPPGGALAGLAGAALWPPLLAEFGLEMPEDGLQLHSKDPMGKRGRIPPYFNLGFLALTPAACAVMADAIFGLQDRLLEVYASEMRCQIAVTLAALRHGLELMPLPAEYNAANDPYHFEVTGVAPEAVRVLHYQYRAAGVIRERIVLPEYRGETLALRPDNPIDRLLLERVRDFLDATAG